MAAFKVVQKIGTITGSNSVDIALKSGYLRVTPVADSFIEVGTNASATSDSSIFVPADESIILKERAVASNFVGITTSDHGTTFTFPSGVESPFAIGDTIEVTNTVGFNTSKALVTGIAPINYGRGGFESSQSGGVTIGVGSSDKTEGAFTGNLRRVVTLDVATGGSTKTHITEVQVAGDF